MENRLMSALPDEKPKDERDRLEVGPIKRLKHAPVICAPHSRPR
jgi:hypothetical protein